MSNNLGPQTLHQNLITARVIFEPTWMPRTYPDPRANTSVLKSQAVEANTLNDAIEKEMATLGSGILKIVDEFNAAFATALPITASSVKSPCWGWSWYGDFDMLSTALGGQAPTWDVRNGCFWPARERTLSWVKSVSDVARIPIPQWERQLSFWEMIESRQRWYEAFPYNPPGNISGGVWNQPQGREPVKFLNYMSFIDMGPHLFGADEFMMIVAGDAQMAEALMAKFFELSTSYASFMQAMQGGKVDCLVGFGGDYACMLSPEMYRKYSVEWDRRLFEHFQKRFATPEDTPCNLHSCGPSSHLYSNWGSHPLRNNITTMQTRLLPEHVKSLRKNLPKTLIQLTFHPEHFDFATVEHDRTSAVLRQAVEDAGGKNVEFVIFAFANQPSDLERIEANLRVVYREIQKINSGIIPLC